MLAAYVPYAAVNRVVADIQQRLASLGLAKYLRPSQGPLETVTQIRARLGSAKAPPLEGKDLLGDFDAEVERCRSMLARSLPHGHALINGKWLVDHHARTVTSKSREHCRQRWSEHVASLGGHPQVRGWWERFVAA